jgi:AP-1-like transcription factor
MFPAYLPTPPFLYSQRAFRERKERHVKDLEAKLTSLESATHNLKSDNERLKLALERATTEIELLRATSGHGPLSSPPSPLILPGSDVNIETAPDMALKNAYVSAYPASIPSSTLLPVSATWDLIQSHHLFKAGLVDIGDVCERLKKVTKCDGEGPAFEEADVWKAVEESRRSGGDELI